MTLNHARPEQPQSLPECCRRHTSGAVHQIGATAECGVQHAGPIARSTGDASAADHTRAAAFASCDHVRIDLGLIDTAPACRFILILRQDDIL
jgi:hypothetical protein